MTTAKKILSQANAWVGRNEHDRSFIKILDIYNQHSPIARGYKIKPTDEWCACTISAIFIAQNCAVGLLGGTEVSCQKFIDIFKAKGIWIEDGSIKPQPGDIILYDWNSTGVSTTWHADHIGIVHEVSGDSFTTIEGNLNRMVSRRTCNVGWKCIRGFARPKYEKEAASVGKNIDDIAREVISGKWGTGEVRKQKLNTAGYDYHMVQERVNVLLRR